MNGLDADARALSRGQVRTLLVHADASEPGFRCGDSGRLALTERECRGEGEPVPVLDVVDDAIEEALRQGVDVNVVYEPEARDADRRPGRAAPVPLSARSDAGGSARSCSTPATPCCSSTTPGWPTAVGAALGLPLTGDGLAASAPAAAPRHGAAARRPTANGPPRISRRCFCSAGVPAERLGEVRDCLAGCTASGTSGARVADRHPPRRWRGCARPASGSAWCPTATAGWSEALEAAGLRDYFEW